MAVPADVLAEALPRIKVNEGFRARMYGPPADVPTIGYGSTGSEFPGGRVPATITEPAASSLLVRRLASTYYPPIAALPGLNVNQRAALLDFDYNLGPHILDRGHTVGDLIRAGRLRQAADALLLYDDPGSIFQAGLEARRRSERLLFLEPLTLDQKYELSRFAESYAASDLRGRLVVVHERAMVKAYHVVHPVRAHHPQQWAQIVGQLVVARKHIWTVAHAKGQLVHGRVDWDREDRGWRCSQLGHLVPAGSPL